MDFRTHVNFDHAADQRSEAAMGGCAYCDIVFEDSAARKRHFNNLECLVFLICGTCDDKFDTLTMYIEHVYAEHLPQAALNAAPAEETTPKPDVTIAPEPVIKDQPPSTTTGELDTSTNVLRNPHNCTVCGKLYNNYYNMLRHMESKHPKDVPLIYRCDECDQRFPRQVDVREHMATVHGMKMKRDTATYNCRVCSTSFDHRQPWLDHQEDFHSRFGCHLCDMETDTRSVFEEHLAEHSTLRGNQCTICEHSFNSERGLDTHLGVVHGIRRTQMPKRVLSETEDRKNEDDDGGGGRNGVDEKDDYMEDENDFGNDGDLDETSETPLKRTKFNPLLSPNGDPNGIRKCKLCQETFRGGIALANHMRTHGITVSRQPLHKSSMMHHRFQSRTSSHPSSTAIKTKVISRMRCRICQKRIHTKTSYKRHMLNMHGVRDCVFIKCTVCPAEFSNDKGLKVHMFRTHHISVQQMQDDHRLRPVPKKESTSSEPPPTATANKMFECDICHTVYRSQQQMQAHQATVHGIEAGELVVDVKDEPQSNDDEEADGGADSAMPHIIADEYYDPNTVWWQCRYCDETFNASKKLTIHMNSHEEHDTTDNTCTDCGNIYRTRKSLWVHRHKKHPRVSQPSPCELCVKVFFDRTELMHHLKTHSDTDAFAHLSEMQAQLAEEQLHQQQQHQHHMATGGADDLSCHICGQSFYDKRVLSKHLRTHENVGGAENGSGPPEKFPVEYSFPSYQGQMVDGEYACDMCPKTFPLINALKVHRGWHFRSPDGRQVKDTAHMWQPDQGRGSAAAVAHAATLSTSSSAFKRSRSGGPRIPSCPYCSSTFASGNNLRRHIVEVHKRNEARVIRENGTFSDQIPLEKELECRSCDITFSNRPEWVEHKIAHARTMKPSTTFEWGCEICGRIFTRKERLLAHMATHMSGKRNNSSGQNSDTGDGGNSNSMSSASQSMSRLRQRLEKPREHPGTADSEDVYGYEQDEYMEGDEDEEDTFGGEEEEEEEDDERDNGGGNNGRGLKNDRSSESAASDVEEDANGESGNDNNDEEEEEEEQEQTPKSKPARAYSCDLCQVFFKTAKELRRHVTSHIINGPEIPVTADASSESKSSNRSSTSTGQLDGFKCRLCGSSSESHIDMIACMEAHKVVTSLRCGECKLYFSDAEQVMNHEKLCHPNQFESS